MVIQVRAEHMLIALLLTLPPVLSSTSLLFLTKVVDLLVPLLLFDTFLFRFFVFISLLWALISLLGNTGLYR